MARLLAALKRKRHGQRDWLIGLLIYPHGLRVSEARDLRWERHRPEQVNGSPTSPMFGRQKVGTMWLSSSICSLDAWSGGR
jgi:integrase